MFESKENRNKLVSRHKQHTGPFNFHPPFAFHQNISMSRKSEDTLKIVFLERSSSFFFIGILSRNSTVMSKKTSRENISCAITNLWRLLLFIKIIHCYNKMSIKYKLAFFVTQGNCLESKMSINCLKIKLA